MTSVLRVEQLQVSYNGKQVLRNLSLTIFEGETVAIVGRSGCGKSTLLRVICGLQGAEAGNIVYQQVPIVQRGISIYPTWKLRRDIMFVSQHPNLVPHLSARTNIALGLRKVRGLTRRDAQRKTEEIAEGLGIVDVLDQYPEELSGGQYQRVQLARAVVMQPEVLLLDEITSSIDPQTTVEVAEALWQMRSLSQGRMQAIVLVTHLLNFAAQFATRILFLHEGAIFEEGPAETFAQHATRPETKAFLNIEQFVPAALHR